MLEFQQLLALLVFSILLVIGAIAAFRDNPATRRWFILLASLTLVLLPQLLAVNSHHWIFEVDPAFHSAVTGLNGHPASWLLFSALCVSALLCSFRLFAYWSARRSLFRQEAIQSAQLQMLLEAQQRRVGVRRKVILREGREACSSAGLAPVLVVPRDWRSWSAGTLQAVVTHELVHIRRHDDLWLLLQRLVVEFFWWLPWLRLLPGRLEEAMEESCDDHAALLCADPVGYLEGLVSAARSGTANPQAAFPAMARIHLVARAARFLRTRHCELNGSGLYWTLLSMALILSLSWTLEVKSLSTAADDLGRVVAIAQPGPTGQFVLELAHVERGPPSAVRDKP